MADKPQATVAAIITRFMSEEVKILLTKRRIEPFKGYWCLPGGHIDAFEPALHAVVREVREETGLDYTCRFYAAFDEIIPEMNIHAVVLVYIGQGSGQLMTENTEVENAKWFGMGEAVNLPLAFQHHKILEESAEEIWPK
jgi:8-oxo-dGTP diphosphatase